MTSRLLFWILRSISVSKQTFPRPSVLSSQLQFRHIRSQCQPRTFPAIKRIPVRYETQIQSAIFSNWDKIEKYASIMKCKTDIVESLVRSDTRLVTSFNTDSVCKKMQVLVSYKYSPEEISVCPPLFCLNDTEMEKRLAEMETVRSYHSSLYLACIAKRTFKKKIEEYRNEMKILGDHPSKLHFVAMKLDCHVNDIYDMIDKGHTHLLTRPPSAINALVNIIKHNGFTTGDIRKYPIVLILRVSEARKRFKVAKKCGTLEKMTLRSVMGTNKDKFQNSLQHWTIELSSLDGALDSKEILKKRLCVSDKEVEAMYFRNQVLQKLRAKKIQPCLDILLDEMNIEPSHIVQKPELLYYSSQRLHRRHLILQSAGVEDSKQKVRDLCLNETKFSLFIPSTSKTAVIEVSIFAQTNCQTEVL